MENANISSQQLEQPQITQVAGFIAKTFEILSNEEFNKIIYWSTAGTEFIIKDAMKFQQIVCPRYFRHNKMNSFVRQLNMYGFHKSRTDHSKSIFSHPAFIKDRDDLLITIKRKIRGKLQQNDIPVTPLKRRPQTEIHTTSSKQPAQTGNQLTTLLNLQYPELANNTSFNFIFTKEKLHSFMNLNFTVNNFPQIDLGEHFQQESQDEGECVSIEHKIEGLPLENQDNNKERNNHSYKFMNPSCFFDSIRKANDI